MATQSSGSQEFYPTREPVIPPVISYGPSSGVVFLDGGVFYGYEMDGVNGYTLDSSGADPAVIINALFLTLGAGGRVVLLESTYPLADTQISTQAANQVIEGEGDGTYIDAALDDNEHAIVIAHDGCAIKNLRARTLEGQGLTSHCIYNNDNADFIIDNVTIVNSDANGVHIVHSATVQNSGVIRNCRLKDADGSGIFVDDWWMGDTQTLIIDSCLFRPDDWVNGPWMDYAINGDSGLGKYVMDCEVYGVDTGGIYYAEYVDNCKIHQYVTDASANGMQNCAWVTNCTVDAPSGTGFGGVGIYNGTLCQGCKVEYTVGAGIQDYNWTCNNQVTGCTSYGIYTTQPHYWIMENFVNSTGDYGIHVASSETSVINNYLNNCDGGVYGIYLASGNGMNVCFGNYQVGCKTYDGDHTSVHEHQWVPFTAGGNASGFQVAQFIHADGAPKGWEIDTAAEWAMTFTSPQTIYLGYCVLSMWIVGVALASDADGMMLEIDLDGGIYYGAGAGYSAQSLNIHKASLYAAVATNMIAWHLDPSDVGCADLDLIGKAACATKVIYHAAEGAYIATDVALYGVLLELQKGAAS